jgi:hypothetical protein
MKLTAEDTSNLQTILATCALGGIESIVIEDGVLRGINEAKTCGLISNVSVPKFKQKIGLSRLSSLKQRLDLFGAGAVIDAKETERGEIASLNISTGRSNVQFRCTSTMLIKAPKKFNDDAFSRVFVTKAELKMVLDAIKVMGAKKIALSVRKDRTVTFELSDASNDSFRLDLENPAERLSDEDADSVVHYYPADVFTSIMRSLANDTNAFDVGVIGIIQVVVNGHNVSLLPQINEDGEEDNE